MPDVLDQDFVSTHFPPLPPEPQPWIISGQITQTPTGVHLTDLDGISVILLSRELARRTITKDGGFYQFDNLPNGNYAIYATSYGQPITPVGVTALVVNNANVVFNFTVSMQYVLSGSIRDNGGALLSGVTVNVVGPRSGSVVTSGASSTNYTYGQAAVGIYTITPSLAGYTFSPESRTLTTGGHGLNQDFTGTPI